MTNFEKVGEFHTQFGHLKCEQIDPAILEKQPELIKSRIALISEEYKELLNAVENKNLPETIDALVDLLYVIYGMGHCMGVNLNKAFDIVHSSNMSKTCDLDTARETVSKNDQLNYRMSGDGKHYLVYNKNTGKIGKPLTFKPPNFDQFIQYNAKC